MRIIDPPSGWMYGFPKPFNPKEGQTTKDWLIENGYPEKTIDGYGDYFYCRFWEEESSN